MSADAGAPPSPSDAGIEPPPADAGEPSFDAGPHLPRGPTPIAVENERPGSADWLIVPPPKALTTGSRIEGYASLTSVNRGDSIHLYVKTTDPRYRIEVYRMGWYQGLGAREVTRPITRTAVAQPDPTVDPVTGLLECAWRDPYELKTDTVRGEWLSGVYVAKLTAEPSGAAGYIIFVVRDDERRSDLLFQVAFSTYEAYNNWGGASTYPSNSRNHRPARKVSYDRPFAEGLGSGRFFVHEYNMVRFLEREGYDVSYSSSTDTHADAKPLLRHRAFLSVGHDEYWSYEARAHVQAARDNGVNLGFFGANAIYWQVRYEPSTHSSAPDRILVAYKTYAPSEDPDWLDPVLHPYSTVRFRDLGRPEDELIGVMYNAVWPIDADVVIADVQTFVTRGVDLEIGDHLTGLAGYEVDSMFGNAPANTVLIGHSPVHGRGVAGFSDMTVYTATSGATVFATGSQQWSWGLDDFYAKGLSGAPHGSRVSAKAQGMTRNVLGRFVHPDPTHQP